MDLSGINFSDFAITCSIYLKKCDEFDVSGYIQFLVKMGQFANFARYPQTIVSLRYSRYQIFTE